MEQNAGRPYRQRSKLQTDAIKAAAREAAKTALNEARQVAEPSSGGDGASSSGALDAVPALAVLVFGCSTGLASPSAGFAFKA